MNARLQRIYKNTVLPNLGICFTLISQLFNCFMMMFCKILISDKDFEKPMHPLQILFVRMSITYFFCVLYFLFYEKNKDFPLGPKDYRGLLLLRAMGGFVGVGGQYWSLIYLNLSDTIAITFLSPTVTSLMAFIFLHEKFTLIEAIGGIFAFLGVLLIAKPHFLVALFQSSTPEGGDDTESTRRLIGTCFAVVSTLGTAVAMCSIRKIGFNAHPLFMVSVYALFTIIASFVGILILPGLSFQIPHTLTQWALLTAIGVTGFFMQFLLTAGMQREKAARAISMTYTQLVYASIFDFITNGTIPEGWSLVGEIVIVLSVFSIIYFKDSSPRVREIPTDTERGIELESYKDETNNEGEENLSNFNVSSEEEDPLILNSK